MFYESTALTHRFNNFLYRSIRKIFFYLSTRIIVPSSWVTQTLLDHGVDRNKIIESINPIDYTKISNSISVRQKKEIDNTSHKFVFIGQFIQRKNVLALLSAFTDKNFANHELKIMGKGPQESLIRESIETMKLEDRVEVIPHGNFEKLMDIMSDSMTLVLPSTEEVWGMVVAEALCAGMHVVVNCKAGITSQIRHMDGVFMCGSQPESIASAMYKSMEKWSGRIQNPSIIEFSADRFWRDFLESASNLDLSPDKFRYKPENFSLKNIRNNFEPTKVLWISDFPSFYRFPIWELLNNIYELQLYFRSQDKVVSQELIFKQDTITTKFLVFSLRRNVRKFVSDLRKSKVIIIGGWSNWDYLVGIYLAVFYKKFLLIHYGSTVRTHRSINPLLKFFRKMILGKADIIVSYGEDCSRSLEFAGIDIERIKTLFNPVDNSFWTPKSDSSINLYKMIKTHKFIYVGQLIERKNVLQILKVFENKNFENDTLTLVGEGSQKEYLMNQIKFRNLEKRVTLIPKLKPLELRDLYRRHHTLILASNCEVWGLVVNEALSCGLNVVVSSLAGVSRLLEPGERVHKFGNLDHGLLESMTESKLSWVNCKKDEVVKQYSTQQFTNEILNIIDKHQNRNLD